MRLDHAHPILLFRALHYRNYRLFFAGQCISLVGTWMQQTAMSWLVYRLTGSPFLLGLIAFAGQVPSFFVAPFAGVLVDRWNRHRVLLLTQALSMLQATAVAALVLSGRVRIHHLLLLSLFIGVVNAFDMPTRQSFVIQMVEDRKILGNAIALNSSMVHIARMIGPPIAGILIAVAGEGICFSLNAASYAAVIAGLMLMRVVPPGTTAARTPFLPAMKEGISYAFGFAPIKCIILLLAFTSFLGMPYAVLLPVFAKDIFHGGSHTLGYLMGATGLGAFSGAVFLASRKSVVGLGKIIVIASSVLGGGIAIFSHSTLFPVALVLLLLSGFGMMVLLTSSNSILQTIVEEDKRGRVMSLYTMAFLGMVPFGNLLYGSLASRLGAPDTLLAGGLCCIFGSVLFARKLPALRRLVRPIYFDMGLVRENRFNDDNASGRHDPD